MITEIYIDEKNKVTGAIAGVKVGEDKIKLPADVKVFGYYVKGKNIKGFVPSIESFTDGDVLTLPAHKKTPLTVCVMFGR